MRFRSRVFHGFADGLLLSLLVLAKPTFATDLQYIITLTESNVYTTDPKTGQPTMSPGYYMSPGKPPTYLAWALAPDPALAATFPAVPMFSVFPDKAARDFLAVISTGDIMITGGDEGESDFIRFVHIPGLPGPGANAVFFYSDADPKSPTDVGLPPPVSDIVLSELAPNNVPQGYPAAPSGTVVWVPGPKDPGGQSTDSTGGRYEYVFVSDCSSDIVACAAPAPEPANFALCLAVITALVTGRKVSRR
jgi:hypothetical protein